MADLIKKIKIKKQDGTFTDYIPIGADAVNVETSDGESVELKLNKKPYYYNTVADMKADTKLKVGDAVQTLGYYEENDGGGACYQIVSGEYINDGLHQLLSNNLFAELIIENNEINILQVGGKADNSEDVGSLINEYTKQYDIFLPNGLYKVSTTIDLYNSLRGTNYPRCGAVQAQYAWLIDNVVSGPVILVSHSGDSGIINIGNIGINCEASDYAIKYDPIKGHCYIHHIFIRNLSKTGIACLANNRYLSRGCYVDTVSIFGKAYQTSTGIHNANSDNYFTNIEIMGVHIGIYSGSDLRLSNAHIWCGSMSGHDQNDWWSGTRGIICNSDAIINDLYLDTCFCPIVSNGSGNNRTILINNFRYWMDSSVEESTHYDGTLALTWPEDTDSPYDNIVINNGYIYSKGRLSHIGAGRFQNITLLLHNINEFDDYKYLYGETPVKYSMQYDNETINKYNLIGIIQYKEALYQSGFLKFKWFMNSGQNGEFVIFNRYDQLETTITPMKYYGKSTEHLYYKKENGFIYIYALCTTKETQYSISAESLGQISNITALDLSRIRICNNGGNYTIIKESLDSAQGLIEISRGERQDQI